MRHQHFYIPTDYTTITPDMAKRWMAMEARLDEMIDKALYSETEDARDYEIKMAIRSVVEYIKAGSDE